ncbi:hypothetical protein ABIE52_000354 [Rhodococcus sp. OAS809]
MDWLTIGEGEEAGVHLYRGAVGHDRSTAIEHVIHPGQAIAHREDG